MNHSSSDDENNKSKEFIDTENDSAFSMDQSQSLALEVPGITKLLNRKKLAKESNPDQSPKEAPSRNEAPPSKIPPSPSKRPSLPTALEAIEIPNLEMPSDFQLELAGDPHNLAINDKKTSEIIKDNKKTNQKIPEEVSIKIDAAPEPVLPPPHKEKEPNLRVLKIQKPKKIPHHDSFALWNRESLHISSDPMAHALIQLLDQGVLSAVFLALSIANKSEQPRFISKGGIGPKSQLLYWKGMIWDPLLIPDLWNSFVKLGLVELPPPNAHTSVNSNRNVLRRAFGVNPDHWFTLVRVGSVKACRGVLTLISTTSVLQEVQDVRKFLNQNTNQPLEKKVS